MTYSLGYEIVGEPPYMRITTKNGSRGEDGRFRLTADTYLSDVDREIDRLIVELEDIRRTVKRELAQRH